MSYAGPRAALAVLIAVNILNFYDRHLLGALAEPIRKEFQLNDAQLGMLTTIFIWLYAIVGLPIGRMADTGSRRWLLAGGVMVWSAFTGFAALARTYTMLLISRLGFAVGEAVVAPSATSWIGDLFPPERRARPLALFMLGVPVGGALSYFTAAPIAQAFGWRAAALFAAAPMIVFIPLLLLLREPARGASESQAVHAGASMWSLLRIPAFWWIIASGALLNFNMYTFGAFVPAFLSRSHGYSLAASGVATGFIYLAGGVAGGWLAGSIGDRIRREDRLNMGARFALGAVPFAVLGIWAGFAPVFFLGCTYCFFNTYYGFVYSSIQDIVPPASRGRAMAVYFFAMYVCGASFGPLLTGTLSDYFARSAAEAAGTTIMTEAFRAAGLQQAMLVMPVLSTCLSVVLFAGGRAVQSNKVTAASVAA